MMVTKIKNINSEQDSEKLFMDISSVPEETNSSDNNPEKTREDQTHKTDMLKSEHGEETEEKSDLKTGALPEPDPENITVLTKKLPNKPILPWNRYDSPWESSEEEDKHQEQPSGKDSEPQECQDSDDSSAHN